MPSIFRFTFFYDMFINDRNLDIFYSLNILLNISGEILIAINNKLLLNVNNNMNAIIISKIRKNNIFICK